MFDPRLRSVAMVVLVCLAVILLSAACQAAGTDPYQEGQAFREQVDEYLSTSGDFVAGFCSGAMLPGLLTALAAVVLGKRGH